MTVKWLVLETFNSLRVLLELGADILALNAKVALSILLESYWNAKARRSEEEEKEDFQFS
ncbi:hypothetical protein TBCH5v1_2028 [Thermococcus barophilus]|uniref:Uncharacterized protein n=1 Tax=Thermococcus barophilus TaxID=55802 RepID=A0A0S1XDN7_THEBA|nr:hypothetical protein TBCH5v1_2028 [Thermococcus barophilus]